MNDNCQCDSDRESFPNVAIQPTAPKEGKLWVNSTTGVLKYWNGTEWRPIVGVWN